MAETKPFTPVKLICGIIAGPPERADGAERRLAELFGPIDARGPRVPFAGTDYYQGEMGAGLHRGFVSFDRLVAPDTLADIKIQTNDLEEELRLRFQTKGRAVNLDPGILTAAALFMATTKEFAHRPALQKGIYAHLEFLFTGTGLRRLEWTYPDLRSDEHLAFFLAARKKYLAALRAGRDGLKGEGD